MLCASSCFSAAEEEQSQSKKGLKKQQKEAEKAAKKAEKQAKLVSGLLFIYFFSFLIHIRRPLLTAVGVSTCRAVGHCKSKRCPYPQCGKDYPLFKYSCHLGFVYIPPNKAVFSFTPTA